jgi:magnesium transporter
VIQHLTYGRVTWTNVVNATPSDVDRLSKTYRAVHPLNMEDLLSWSERPKVDQAEDYLFFVMHFPQWDPRKRISRSIEVDIILGRGYLVTAHDGTLKPLNTLFQVCQENEMQRNRLLGKGANHTFYVVLDQLVDHVLPILARVDANIREVEERIFSDDAGTVIQDIALVRRDIIALRRIIRQQTPILDQLVRMNHPILTEDLDEYFGDIADHMRLARDMIDEDSEIIAGLQDTTDTLATHRLNEVIRILTVISVVMLPLTLLSSVYGMNIRLPFDQHPDAFIIVISLMVAIAILMLLVFKRRDWL